ncbi:hypothetical protein BpHYR1_027827 [Brachionus plicatilis]|uniref:Uncharacterized protein n=1 Tax=Brachionus plicatilis TaxID=10195 RepID=A0A3M7RMB2_BRAPC|nr:hypothetical protein BpHYR1_027827 [Brachionus plicatilis]
MEASLIDQKGNQNNQSINQLTHINFIFRILPIFELSLKKKGNALLDVQWLANKQKSLTGEKRLIVGRKFQHHNVPNNS